MRLLALETSCDDSCAAIWDTATGKLLAEKTYSHTKAMQRWGGIVPEVASREHLCGLPLAVSDALKDAKLTPQDLDWIVATNRPGLIGALVVGLAYGKSLAFALGKPFSTVSHIEAHLFSPLLAKAEGKTPPPFPWIALVVSGGHTELFFVEGVGKFKWLGGTLDDAAGEAFDKVGKAAGLEYPAGPIIDKMAAALPADQRELHQFPRAQVSGFNYSFSGLKTSVGLELQKHHPLEEVTRAQILSSAQEAIVDALVIKVRRAQKELGGNVIVTGGVACNGRLRERLPQAYFPAPRHCSDNAGMVAALAAAQFEAGCLEIAPLSVTASAREDWETWVKG